MRNKRVLIGILLILGAVILLVDGLGLVPGMATLGAWTIVRFVIKVVISIYLVSYAVKSIRRKNFASVLFPIAIILSMFSIELGLDHISNWTWFIAAGLLSLGLNLIFKGNRNCFYMGSSGNHERSKYSSSEGGINMESVFTGGVRYVDEDEFESMNVNTVFSRSSVYFDNTKLKDGKGTINITGVFSTIDLYIPKEWEIKTNVDSVFGGVSENRGSQSTSDNQLFITGEAVFTGINIIYV